MTNVFYYGHDRVPSHTPLYKDHGKFFIQLQLLHQAKENMHIVAEPGDATRYELFIIYIGSNEKIVVIPGLEWSTWIGSEHDITSGQIKSDYEFARCVYADLVNQYENYYDWKEHHPAKEKV